MNKTLEISAMQYDFHILTNTNQKSVVYSTCDYFAA